ncbi:MAG: hypothetical protein IJQ02_11675 [Oscillospiraceae bacterium]|nr:hypothetical protein [Oscillospiraceae bacterium]
MPEKESYLCISSELIDRKWYRKPGALMVFLYLLMTANISDGFCMGLPVYAGQAVTSMEVIAEKTGLPRSVVQLALICLTEAGDISPKSHGCFSVFTIHDYDLYLPETHAV